ncbi:hypothetical protein BDC45DRAFT_77513 [Circinella umbellata]|nr:hypothetical protein BDC45DRAFT_77513 [Circinella umbellata]
MEDDSSNNNNIWSSHFFFSKQCIDLEAHRKTLDDNAIQNSQLQQASDDTIAIINNFFESHLFVFLDIRSQAHAMLGHYDAAYADVKKMIQCAPNSAVGYLKKGNILSISGRYRRAIKAYSKGIKKITMATTEASDGKNQREKEKQEEIRQLLVAKRNEATMMNTISIDFLSIFPNEINDIIISQLSQRRRLTCLTVSRFWRRTILESASGWKKLSFHKHSMDGCPWLLNIIPLIGRFVKKLTFGNTDEQTLLRCFELITQGHFSKIQQLQITANSTRNLHPLSVNNTVLTAFSRMNVSLTYLNLNIGINKESITLASIIQLCKNLTHIRFSNGTDLRDVVGDFTHAEQQNALINLELESAFITGRDIRTLLQKCQCIRRLIMLGCTTSVLKTINNYALNLEILGYNPSFAVPELNEKKENREKINGNELYSYYIDKNSNTNGITHHDVQNPTGKKKDCVCYMVTMVDHVSPPYPFSH